jgi:branched-chain amino acid transport system substrate-binding protein
MVLLEAIKRAGTTESGKLRDAIAATKEHTGITGKITLDAQRNAQKAAVILTVKDGNFKFVETVTP